MPPVVRLVDVSKRYGLVRALEGVTMDIEAGQAVAFLGPNGAGKSTLLKIVAAQIAPSVGLVKVLDRDAFREPEMVKRGVGFVGHGSFLYDELTVEENLGFYGGFFGASENSYERVIEATGLQRWRRVKAGQLSYGLRRRADIARALLGRPRILVLDELFAGLDREASDLITRHLRGEGEQTLLVSSHSVERVGELCGRGVFLRRGSIERDEGL